jgi:hypothetical protein
MIWEFAVRCSMGRMGQFQWFQPFHRFATFIIGIEPFQSFQSFHRYARFQLFDELTMSGPNLTTASLCSNRLTRPPPLNLTGSSRSKRNRFEDKFEICWNGESIHAHRSDRLPCFMWLLNARRRLRPERRLKDSSPNCSIRSPNVCRIRTRRELPCIENSGNVENEGQHRSR